MTYYNYFTEIEEHFVRKRGKHLLISPMDWNLIATWRDAGVPLHVALRGIDIAMDSYFSRQRGNHSRVNSLCYCHDSVMEAFAGYLETHVGESDGGQDVKLKDGGMPDPTEGSREAIADFLSARINEIKAIFTKQYPEKEAADATIDSAARWDEMSRVISRLSEIAEAQTAGAHIDMESLERDLRIIDDLLMEALRARVTPEEAAEWDQEAKKQLKVYKKRLPKETFDKIQENFLRDKIRRKFSIGELSLFRL